MHGEGEKMSKGTITIQKKQEIQELIKALEELKRIKGKGLTVSKKEILDYVKHLQQILNDAKEGSQ